jgi:hypothetical protein
MKFEDIKSEKFSMFENVSLNNLKMVVGGDWTNTDTIAGAPGDIDRFNTGKPGQEDGWQQTSYTSDHVAWGIG